jgi:hypothetical protein
MRFSSKTKKWIRQTVFWSLGCWIAKTIVAVVNLGVYGGRNGLEYTEGFCSAVSSSFSSWGWSGRKRVTGMRTRLSRYPQRIVEGSPANRLGGLGMRSWHHLFGPPLSFLFRIQQPRLFRTFLSPIFRPEVYVISNDLHIHYRSSIPCVLSDRTLVLRGRYLLFNPNSLDYRLW